MAFPFLSLIPAALSAVGGLFSGNREDARADKNDALQREFAQSGIQWKVADAKKAGIHPLAALGAQTHSYSPVSVGGNDFGTGIAAAGQDVSRAIDATRTAPQRSAAVVKTMQDLELTRMGLENELLASQIAKIRVAGHPPPMQQGDVGPVSYPLPTLGKEDFAARWRTGASATAEQVERDYGDIIQNVYGMGRLGVDYLTNTRPFFDWAARKTGFGR